MVRKPKRHRVGYERELARELWEKGYVVVRSPASGGSKRSYPVLDLFAWDPKTGKLYAIEVKTTSSKDADLNFFVKMLSDEELEKMELLRRRGVEVLLYAKVLRKGGWRVYKYPSWEETDPL